MTICGSKFATLRRGVANTSEFLGHSYFLRKNLGQSTPSYFPETYSETSTTKTFISHKVLLSSDTFDWHRASGMLRDCLHRMTYPSTICGLRRVFIQSISAQYDEYRKWSWFEHSAHLHIGRLLHSIGNCTLETSFGVISSRYSMPRLLKHL